MTSIFDTTTAGGENTRSNAPPSILIRKATLQDAESLRAMHRMSLRAVGPSHYSPPQVEGFLRDVDTVSFGASKGDSSPMNPRRKPRRPRTNEVRKDSMTHTTQAIVIHETGGPDVLKWKTVPLPETGLASEGCAPMPKQPAKAWPGFNNLTKPVRWMQSILDGGKNLLQH